MALFIHSVCIYWVLSANWVAGTILSAEETATNKTVLNPCLYGFIPNKQNRQCKIPSLQIVVKCQGDEGKGDTGNWESGLTFLIGWPFASTTEKVTLDKHLRKERLLAVCTTGIASQGKEAAGKSAGQFLVLLGLILLSRSWWGHPATRVALPGFLWSDWWLLCWFLDLMVLKCWVIDSSIIIILSFPFHFLYLLTYPVAKYI